MVCVSLGPSVEVNPLHLSQGAWSSTFSPSILHLPSVKDLFFFPNSLYDWLLLLVRYRTHISPLSTAFYADPVYSSMPESTPLPHYCITLTWKYYVNLRFFRLYFCCLFKSKSALPTFVIHSVCLYEGNWATQGLEHIITSQVKWKLGE